MVITSNPPNGSDSTQLEPSESVEEPPIRGGGSPQLSKSKHDHQEKEGVAVPDESTPDHDICAYAHTFDPETITKRLGVVKEHGLSHDEAAARLARAGPNKIKDSERVSIFQIFIRQISNSLTLVLLITMILSFSLQDYIEGAVITFVIVLNIVVGFIQDYRAEQTILSLQALSTPECKVVRDSQIKVIKAETLVVGDIVQLTAGGVVPADLRLIESINLSTDEALLTGESVPISKFDNVVFSNTEMPIGDRTNMVYSASMVTRGRATGVVVAIGMATEVGKIAALLQDKKHSKAGSSFFKKSMGRFWGAVKNALGLVGSPLQVKLSKFALLLFGLAILLAIIVFSASLWDVEGEVLIYGICVAVAVIPESLIAVLTLTIAVGTKAMAKSNIVIRKLASLEAVGGVTNICSDKTGTLTQGKMIVRRALIQDGETLVVHGTTNPFDPTSGTVEVELAGPGKKPGDQQTALDRFLDIISLCNISTVQNLNRTESGAANQAVAGQGNWTAIGEPTEIALHVFAMRFGHGKAEAVNLHNRSLIAEFAFDSTIKRMSMAYSSEKANIIDIFTKGAVEAVLPITTCSDEEKARIADDAERMAGEGLRVLCLASKVIQGSEKTQLSERNVVEQGLTFAGLIGLYDPPRAETAGAVRTCRQAGITVHMLTGDHIRTATAIAAEVGIVDASLLSAPTQAARREIMAAQEFDKLSDAEIDGLEKLPLVIARCSPATKVKMVKALHRRKAFCIMTGDGINDSPALKLADIGIAMGLNGSDVAKQAADMVLADDNFASIVSAIQEGRRLFDNIQKFLLHLLTSNIAQVVLLMIGLALKDENDVSVFPLSPIEILWANLVTSSPLALGLGLEPGVVDIMNRPPRSMRVGVFTKQLILDKMVYGVTMGSLCLAAFVSVVYGIGDGNLGLDCNQDYHDSCDVVFRARATTFSFLSFALLATAWEVKDMNASLFNMNIGGLQRSDRRVAKIFSVFPTIYNNKFLFWACVSGFLLVFPLVYLPAVNTIVFRHSRITYEWGIVFGCLVLYVSTIETWKAFKRWRLHKTRYQEGWDKATMKSKDSSSV